MKKSSCKLEKEQDVKMKEMKNEMQNAFDKVNEYMQENEKLQEEVRVLNELRKVNEILKSKITSSGIEMNKENKDIEDNEELNESVEVIDDYPDDEEVANFFDANKKHKTQRTGPLYEAEAPKSSQSTKEPRLACSKCEYKAKNRSQLNQHIKDKHTEAMFQCGMCEFKGNKKVDLAWHTEDIHKRKETQHGEEKKETREVCKFWQRGYCRFRENQCRFQHGGLQRCFQGQSCTYWPYCKFSHSSDEETRNMCRYQNSCRRNDCQFFHMDGNFLGMSWGVPPMDMRPL